MKAERGRVRGDGAERVGGARGDVQVDAEHVVPGGDADAAQRVGEAGEAGHGLRVPIDGADMAQRSVHGAPPLRVGAVSRADPAAGAELLPQPLASHDFGEGLAGDCRTAHIDKLKP
jgi:hypothetical protein